MEMLVLQLADSAFPTGGFAHSAGLEAAHQTGAIRTPDDLHAFVRWTLAQAGRGALPLVMAAHRDIERLPEIDELCDVFIRNPVANRASRLQGRAWLATAVRVFDRPLLRRIALLAADHRLALHQAPVFGAILSALHVEASCASELYLFMTARAVLSAGVRLGIAGTHEGQRLQAEVADVIDRVRHRSATLTLDDLAQAAPLVDLWQAGHDRLYSRLFQS